MQLRIHPEAAPWAPSPSDRRRLEQAFPGPRFVATLEPRRRIPDVLGPSYARTPYAFRALTRPGHRSVVFVDPTETQGSATWVLAHELGHQLLQDRPGERERLAAGRPRDLDPAGDRFHQVDPEERYADGVATRTLGTAFDREWWRGRVKREGFGGDRLEEAFSGIGVAEEHVPFGRFAGL